MPSREIAHRGHIWARDGPARRLKGVVGHAHERAAGQLPGIREAAQRLMRAFTDITGREDLYEQNAAAVEQAIDDIVAQVPAENPPTALVLTPFSSRTAVAARTTMFFGMLLIGLPSSSSYGKGPL